MSFFQRVWSLRRYSFMLEQLVKRDFKVRYRGSVLGVLWSVLNPLLNMIVMSIVFSQVFRGIENYKMYLLAGITIYNYFSEGSNLAMSSVLANSSLIGKVYVPKAVFPLSKCLSSGINLLLSLLPLYLVLLLLPWEVTLVPNFLVARFLSFLETPWAV